MKTKEQLEEKIWYRAVKVLFVTVVFGATLSTVSVIWSNSTESVYVEKTVEAPTESSIDLSKYGLEPLPEGSTVRVLEQRNISPLERLGRVLVAIVIILLSAVAARKIFHYVVLGKPKHKEQLTSNHSLEQ